MFLTKFDGSTAQEKTLKAHSAMSKGHEGTRQRLTEPLPSAVSERNAGSSDAARLFSCLEGQVKRHKS